MSHPKGIVCIVILVSLLSSSLFADSPSVDIGRKISDKVASKVRMFDLKDVKLLKHSSG